MQMLRNAENRVSVVDPARNAQRPLVDMNALVKIPLSTVKTAIKVSSTFLLSQISGK